MHIYIYICILHIYIYVHRCRVASGILRYVCDTMAALGIGIMAQMEIIEDPAVLSAWNLVLRLGPACRQSGES